MRTKILMTPCTVKGMTDEVVKIKGKVLEADVINERCPQRNLSGAACACGSGGGGRNRNYRRAISV